MIGWGVGEGPVERKMHRYVGAHSHHMYAHSVLIHAHTETRTSTWTHICTHANTCSGYTCTHKLCTGTRNMHANMCTQVYTYTFAHRYMHAHIDAHMQIHAQKCTHRYIHAYRDTFTQVYTARMFAHGHRHTSAHMCTQIHSGIHIHTDADMHTRYVVCAPVYNAQTAKQRGGEKLGGGKQSPGKQ